MTEDVREYVAVRDLWKAHSLAEDGRDLEGLIATLTPDCVYEVVPTGHRWEGHDGARGFYKSLLGAFPDLRFELRDIVIGPQGVCEEARLTGTHERDWLEYGRSPDRLSGRDLLPVGSGALAVPGRARPLRPHRGRAGLSWLSATPRGPRPGRPPDCRRSTPRCGTRWP